MWSAPGREKKKDKTKGWGRRYVLLRGGEAPQLEWRDPRESRQTRGNLNLALSTIDSQYARIRFSLPLSCLIVLPRFWVIVNLISNLLISFPSTIHGLLHGFLHVTFISTGFYSRLGNFPKRLGQLSGRGRAHCALLRGFKIARTVH